MTKEEKAVYDREYRAKNKARIAANKVVYAAENREKETTRIAAWVEANRDRSREIKQAWKVRNPDADKTPERYAKHAERMRWVRKNRPHIHKRNNSLRRAKVSHATPPWANKTAIKAMYVAARAAGLHVDHVIPLKGKYVSGLHVENNLQLLTPKQNRAKGNRHAD